MTAMGRGAWAQPVGAASSSGSPGRPLSSDVSLSTASSQSAGCGSPSMISPSDRGREAATAGTVATGNEWHLITSEYPPQIGGVSDHSHLLATALVDAG